MDKQTISIIGTWFCVLLLIGIALMIAYYPAGQAYARCESNAPLIDQYYECRAMPDKYPSFQCLSTKSDLGYGKNITNWTVSK